MQTRHRGKKKTMNKLEIVIIPTPLKGHLVSTIELVTQLLSREERFSATILLIKSPLEISNTNTGPYSHSHPDMEFVDVPAPENLPPPQLTSEPESIEKYFGDYLGSHSSAIKDVMTRRFETGNLAAVVVDMFWSAMIGAAEDLGVPSYVFFTSGAGFLGLMLFLHRRLLRDGAGAVFGETDGRDSLEVPSYANPVPVRVCPNFMLRGNRGWESLAGHAAEFRRARGVIVNTALELEPHAVESLASLPPVYTVGPLLDLAGTRRDEEIMGWLDGQPAGSVVFLCFGSMGAFGGAQMREIAAGLDRSGHRFLWSVRRGSAEAETLPEGTMGRGRLCGWAPQAAVLAHPAVGGFVSHCGWNSILESAWHGVPIAAWPLYAEQHANAFQVARDLGLAVEVRLDYRGDVMAADAVELAVRHLMDDGAVRKRAAEMSERCRRAVAEGGSSFLSLRRLVEDMLANACTLRCIDR